MTLLSARSPERTREKILDETKFGDCADLQLDKISPTFGEDDSLVSKCFLLPQWRGLAAPSALAHEVTGTPHNNLVLQERPTVQNKKDPGMPAVVLEVAIYKGCSFLLWLFITRLHTHSADSPAENIDKLLTLNFL